MSRNKKREQVAYDAALAHFDSDMNRFVHAINTQLLKKKLNMLSTQAVAHWRIGGIPSNRARTIEAATGGAVSREQLRPDLFA